MIIKNALVLLLLVISISHDTESYNILVVFGHPGQSHFQAFDRLFIELGLRGHNVTVLSHVPFFGHKNIRHIPLRDKSPMTHVMNLKQLDMSRLKYYLELEVISNYAAENCPKDMSHPNFQNFLKEDHEFDLIMVEFFNTNCYYGIINKFKAPFIGLSSSYLFPWIFEWFETPQNPAVHPVVNMGYKKPMSFLARVENTFLQIIGDLWYKYRMEKPGYELSKNYIGYEAADPHNASLILVNTHHTLHGARPLTPSIVEVGGLHVSNRKPKKLSMEIEDWINNSDAGVIYFNLGSMIKSDTFPEEQRKAFARAFSKLPQRVLWKWENDTMQDKPDNVMIGKWMPQFDILCHRNIKAFISHGGLLGTTEAVHCGVPIIVMPQFGDQKLNAYAIESNGIGVILDLHDATERSVTEALQKVLNPRVNQNAKALSQRFRDRPLSAMDTAVYWVEHIARHKGGAHMRSQSIGMPFHQYFLLDVITFTFLVMFAVFFILFKLIVVVLRLTLKSTKKGDKKKLS